MNPRDDPTETVERHLRAHEQRATVVHMGAAASLYDDRGHRGEDAAGGGAGGLERRKRSQSDLSMFLTKMTATDDGAVAATATPEAPAATAAAPATQPAAPVAAPAVRSYQEILMAATKKNGDAAAPVPAPESTPSPAPAAAPPRGARAQRRRSNSLNASDLLSKPGHLSSSSRKSDVEHSSVDDGPAPAGRIPYKWKESTYDTDLSPSNLLPTAIFGPALSPDCFTEFAQGDPQEEEMNVDARDASVVLVDLLVPAMAKVPPTLSSPYIRPYLRPYHLIRVPAMAKVPCLPTNRPASRLTLLHTIHTGRRASCTPSLSPRLT
jgi:hypothetical protein